MRCACLSGCGANEQIRSLGRSHSRHGGKGNESSASTIAELEARVVEEETNKLQVLHQRPDVNFIQVLEKVDFP